MIRMSARRAPREIGMSGRRSLRLRRMTDMAIRVNRTVAFAQSNPVAYTTDLRVTLRQTSVPPTLHDSTFTRR